MKLLCLSDIHGHLDALSAVLATAERRGYHKVLVAGDICFPGPQPLETWRRLSRIGAVCAQGVGDRALATLDPATLHPRDAYQQARLERLQQVRAELGEGVLRQLAKLPQVVRQPLDPGRQLLLVHGSPADPLEAMTHDLSEQAILRLLGEEPCSLVLCGGSHLPFDRVVERLIAPEASSRGGAESARQAAPRRLIEMPSHTRVVNLGSVGEAVGACDGGGDSQSYEPRFAHATFVQLDEHGLEIEQFVVPLGWAA